MTNIIQNDIFKLSREIQEPKENVINEVENQNQDGEKHEEIVENGNIEINNEVHNEENVEEEEEHFEEMNYENGGEMEQGDEIHYGQGEEINFEEDGEEMNYEEEYENENGYEEHNHDENEHENEDENNQE